MPFIVILIGIMLISSGARNRASQLGALITNDFSGQNNFFIWIAAIGGVGAVGYYEPLRPVSRLFLFLVLLSMLLSNKGFFTNLMSAVQNFQAPAPSSVSDTGAATADPGTGITGPVQSDNTAIQQSTADLISKYGAAWMDATSGAPATTPLPTDFLSEAGGPPLSMPSSVTTLGAFNSWWNSLPETAQTGPSKQNPNIMPGQPNSSANNYLNKQLGTLMPSLFQGTMSFFGIGQ